MRNIAEDFGTLYIPQKAFVIYRAKKKGLLYVESYDMDENGFPINAHPLSTKECTELAKALDSSQELKRSFLKPAGLLPKNVMYINPDHNGYAVWHTPQQDIDLLFTDSLGIASGKANVPAMVWRATKENLWVYAVQDADSIGMETELYHAPFFNVYEKGNVCMGSVAVKIPPDCQLEDFMQHWQHYFFGSYFSHLFQGHLPVKGNIVQLWQSLVNTGKKFPLKSLIKNKLTLKNIIQ